jgi:hypothetical protein
MNFRPAAARKHLLNMAQVLSAEGASGEKPGVERSEAPGINQSSRKALKARRIAPHAYATSIRNLTHRSGRAFGLLDRHLVKSMRSRGISWLYFKAPAKSVF